MDDQRKAETGQILTRRGVWRGISLGCLWAGGILIAEEGFYLYLLHFGELQLRIGAEATDVGLLAMTAMSSVGSLLAAVSLAIVLVRRIGS